VVATKKAALFGSGGRTNSLDWKKRDAEGTGHTRALLNNTARTVAKQRL